MTFCQTETGAFTCDVFVKTHLRSGTALAGALALGAMFPAIASAQSECGVPVNGTVTCSPTANPYPNGVTYIAPPSDLTIVLPDGVVINTTGGPNNGVLALGIGNAAIAVRGATNTAITTNASGANGVLGATTDGALTVAVDRVTTSGANASGIFASSATGLTTVSANRIATTGVNADGITANTNNGAIIIDAGTITTSGNGAKGVDARSDGANVTVSADSISTAGNAVGVIDAGANGILAVTGGAGNVTVDAGTITTTGTGAIGVLAQTFNGTARVSADTVTTSGDNASGISVNATGVTGRGSVDAGRITTGGANANGIVATGLGGVDLTFDSITTTGANAVGVMVPQAVLLQGIRATPTIVIDGGDITTSGVNADGIRAFATNTATFDLDGTIATSGSGARGIVVTATNSVTITGAGDVTTRGDNATAIDVSSTAGPIDLTVGDVSTSGNLSGGVRAIGGLNSNVAVTTGNVATTGTAGSNYSFLPTSTAITATTQGTGNVSVDAGNLSTAGLGAAGVNATAALGDADVAVGNVRTLGARANGVTAQSTSGDVAVTTGTISTTGDNSAGVYAVARGGGVVVDSGAITTRGFNARGINAISGAGGADIGFTSVEVGGVFSSGISAIATGGGVVVSGADVTTTGASNFGIYAASDVGNVAVTTSGTVSSTGPGSSGIFASSGTGRTAVTVNNVSVVAANDANRATTRAGVIATGASAIVTSTGTVRTTGSALYGGSASGVQVTGTAGSATANVNNVSTTGSGINGARAVVVTATGGAAAATVNGMVTTTGAATDAVAVTSDQAVTVTNRGTITATGAGSNGIVATSGTGSAIINTGNLSAANLALVANGGRATVTNSGVLTGRIQLSDGNDTFTNSGRFVLTGNSNFGLGNDTFINSGTITTQLGVPGTAGFLGLELLSSSGLIELRNGRVGDNLSTSGNFVGNNGQLGVDVNLGANTSDRLVIGGSATGTTAVLINRLDNGPVTLGTNTTIVQAGAGSSPTAFTIDPLIVDQGLIQLGLVFNPGNSTFNIQAAPGVGVFRTGAIAGSLRNLWLQSADAWSGQSRALRDNIAANSAGGTGGRFWLQGYGQKEEFDRTRPITVGGTTTDTDLGIEQDYFGAQVGLDLGGSAGEGGFAFGITGGYLNSNLAFNGTADRVNFDVVNAGVYANYTSGMFFLNALGKYDYHWGKNVSQSGRYATDMNGSVYGARGEAGLRLGGTVWIEPAVSLSYTHVDIDDFDVDQGSFGFEADEGLLGKAGARVGFTLGSAGNTRVQGYVGGNYVREFNGRDGVSFVSGGQTVSFVQDRPDDFAEGIVGLNIGSDGGAISGFFEGRYATGDDYDGYGARAGIRLRF